MKISILMFLAVLLIFSSVSFGQFMGEGSQGITTVAEAKKMGDETRGTLEGYIVNQLQDDHYTFRDDTGEMEVEIGNKKWRGQKVSPETKVRIYGEMERGFFSSEFEVKKLEIITEADGKPSGSTMN